MSPPPDDLVPVWRSGPVGRRRSSIRRLLALMGGAPVDFYDDACRVIDERPGLATASHLVGHLSREIEGLVRDLLIGVVPVAEMERLEAEPRPKGQRAPDRGLIIDAICTALGFRVDDEVRQLWKKAQWHGDAHRSGLLQPRRVEDALRSRWDQFETLLLRLGRQYEASYTRSFDLVDRLAAVEAPTKERELKRLRENVPHSDVAMRRFFASAGEGWFRLLRDKGYLGSPRNLTPDDDGYVTYARWPASEYLVRMAAVESLYDAIVEVMLALDTDNPEAAECLADIAMTVPVAAGLRLVPKIAEQLRLPAQWRLPNKAAELAVRLAEAGHVEEAVRVVEPLLPVPSRRGASGHGVPTEVIAGTFPALGQPGLAMLASRLRCVATGGADHLPLTNSRMWRRNIDSGRRHDGRDELVSMLRDGAVSVAEASGAADVVSLLENYPEALFQRLSLHVLRWAPDLVLVEQRLTSRALFDNRELRREYDLLLREQFARLSDPARDTIMGFVNAGPTADEPGGEERWEWRQVARFGDALPYDQRGRFQELVRRFGTPASIDTPFPISEWVGPTAPVDAAAIAAMDDEALIELLAAFASDPAQPQGPSPAGLQRELEASVTADPARFSALAERFADLEPTYANGVLTGLTQALQAGRRGQRELPVMDWPSVLLLGRAVLEQPRLLPGRPSIGDGDRDPGWLWCRQQLAELLAEGLRADSLPPDQAGVVLRLLSELAEDPEPEDDYDDPPTEAINTVRGWALIAVIDYALWRHRGRAAAAMAGLDEDVQQILDRHLDPSVDASKAIRAVYGMYFNALAVCDPDWTRSRTIQIFENLAEPRGLAAWDAYLRFSTPTPRGYGLLAELYARAVTALPAGGPTATTGADATSELEDAQDQLVGHVASLYAMNVTDLEDGSLLDLFTRHAPVKLRARLVEVLGIMLHNTESPSPEVVVRLQRMWRWRFDRLRSGDDDLAELAGYGWWFASGDLDPGSALEQLRGLLDAGGVVKPGHMVAGQLAAQDDDFLHEVVTCMALLIDSPTDAWFVTGARDEIRIVLGKGIRATEQSTRTTARETINRLIARGYTTFDDLLT